MKKRLLHIRFSFVCPAQESLYLSSGWNFDLSKYRHPLSDLFRFPPWASTSKAYKTFEPCVNIWKSKRLTSALLDVCWSLVNHLIRAIDFVIKNIIWWRNEHERSTQNEMYNSVSRSRTYIQIQRLILSSIGNPSVTLHTHFKTQHMTLWPLMLFLLAALLNPFVFILEASHL